MATSAPPCAECGSDPIHHHLTYVTVAMDEFMRPLLAPGPLLRLVTRGLFVLERHITPALFSFLLARGLAKRVDAPDDNTMLLAKMLWEEATVEGIEMFEYRLFGLPRNLFFATFPSGRRIVFEGIPLPPRGIEQAPWMDNKAELKKRFRKLGFPIAEGGAALTLEGAKRIFKRIEPPAIVKPYSGSGSRHTTLHVRTLEELSRAFQVATQIAPFAVVEEELVGPVFRATVVNGKLEAVLRRDPPHVIGDGTRTVKELIAEANKNPKRDGPYFSKLKIDAAAEVELGYQGLTPDSVPEKGRRVTLNQKVNWSLGGTTADVTDDVHPDNTKLFEDIAHALKSPIVGIDFIIEDMGTSWKEQRRAGVIECNSMPFFDNHHLPFEGKPRNVAAAIWAMVK